MGGAPARFNDGAESHLDAKLQDLEKNLLDASARRIHDFERRLEHEWIALRQLHEEPLKTLEQRTTAITENCLSIVGEALALLRARTSPEPSTSAADQPEQRTAHVPVLHSRGLVLLIALIALAGLSLYTRWSLGRELRETTARAAAAEERVTELQTRVDRENRNTSQTVQRLSAEALASAARAERLVNVLAAADVRSYPMRGQRTAAAADGLVFFSPSRGIALTASKLPATSSQQVYQVWLVTTRGPIALGFVSPDAQGRAGAAFDAPPELSGNVIGFMLSLEATGGEVKPTGPIVLAS